MNKYIFIGLIFFTLNACSKSSSDESLNSVVSFFITDAPISDILEVNIDVQSIVYSTPNTSWDTLYMEPTSVNLLKFSNGLDLLLGKTILEDGVKIDRLRLRLGSNNTLMLADSSIVPLQTPSGQSSGIQVNVDSNSEISGSYSIIIDFNAERSIVSQGNGSFLLRPVIRAFIQANSGSVSGNLTPNIPVRVFTISPSGDTLSTISDTTNNNFYLIRGLNTGIYNIEVQNINTSVIEILERGVTISGNNVDLGMKTIPF